MKNCLKVKLAVSVKIRKILQKGIGEASSPGKLPEDVALCLTSEGF